MGFIGILIELGVCSSCQEAVQEGILRNFLRIFGDFFEINGDFLRFFLNSVRDFSELFTPHLEYRHLSLPTYRCPATFQLSCPCIHLHSSSVVMAVTLHRGWHVHNNHNGGGCECGPLHPPPWCVYVCLQLLYSHCGAAVEKEVISLPNF